MKKSKKLRLTETRFFFKARLWKFDGPAGWCFVTIPKTTGKKIRAAHRASEEGWGRLKATVTIGDSTWKTAIWFDTKKDSYLLPIKTLIRKKESLAIGTFVKGHLDFVLDRFTF